MHRISGILNGADHMSQLSNLPDNLSESSLPGCSDADVAIDALVKSLCDICMSDKVMCPVNRDITLCPCDVVEKAQYEYYNGCD